MIRRMATVFTTMLMALNMRVNGKTTSSMEKVTNLGQMAANSMASTLSLRKRAVGCIRGLMATSISEIGKTI